MVDAYDGHFSDFSFALQSSRISDLLPLLQGPNCFNGVEPYDE